MTRAERVKLAKAARELASEYAEGRGPTITNFYGWCGCVAGRVVQRANDFSDEEMAQEWEQAWRLETADQLLTSATEREAETPGAVVYPLLWLADELESAP